MKEKQLAREAQGYMTDTPICCRTCSNRKEHLCAVGGFPVRLFGYCRCWGTSVPAKPVRVVTREEAQGIAKLQGLDSVVGYVRERLGLPENGTKS